MNQGYARGRIYIFEGLLFLLTIVFVGRLIELQIIFGSQNRVLADGNRIRKTMLPAPRGIIYDRNKRPLVNNVPIFRKVGTDCGSSSNCLVPIGRDEALKMEASRSGSDLKTGIARKYLYGRYLSGVLGYLSELSDQEIKDGAGTMGDLTGRGGIEQEYNDNLRGSDGGEVYEVDTSGQRIREIGRTEPVAGEDLILSIDAELSRVAYQALEGKKGAVVVSKPGGEILALVTSPSFDPNEISQSELTDKSQPFFNRAISGAYPPGSLFKIVSSVAGLEEGKVTRNTIYHDTGYIKVGDYIYKNWLYDRGGGGEGDINIIFAIRRSTDTFFYKLGEWVGAQKLADWAKMFGLGESTGINLPGETTGYVPNPSGKNPSGETWFLGNTYHFAIGQGDLMVTPIQANRMTAVIASGGKLCPMRITTSGQAQEGECKDLGLKRETLGVVREGMAEACAPGGTAYPLFGYSPQLACKTGTAEYVKPNGEIGTHGWLTAYGPVDDPQVVVTAVVEGGGEGSDVAAPIVKKVLDYYWEK